MLRSSYGNRLAIRELRTMSTVGKLAVIALLIEIMISVQPGRLKKLTSIMIY